MLNSVLIYTLGVVLMVGVSGRQPSPWTLSQVGEHHEIGDPLVILESYEHRDEDLSGGGGMDLLEKERELLLADLRKRKLEKLRRSAEAEELRLLKSLMRLKKANKPQPIEYYETRKTYVKPKQKRKRRAQKPTQAPSLWDRFRQRLRRVSLRNIRERIFPYSSHDLNHLIARVTGSPSDYISAYEDDSDIFKLTEFNSPYNDVPVYNSLNDNDFPGYGAPVKLNNRYSMVGLTNSQNYYRGGRNSGQRQPIRFIRRRKPKFRHREFYPLRVPNLRKKKATNLAHEDALGAIYKQQKYKEKLKTRRLKTLLYEDELANLEEDNIYANYADESNSIKSVDEKKIAKPKSILSRAPQDTSDLVSKRIIRKANDEGEMVDWFPLMVTVSEAEDGKSGQDLTETEASLEKWWDENDHVFKLRKEMVDRKHRSPRHDKKPVRLSSLKENEDLDERPPVIGPPDRYGDSMASFAFSNDDKLVFQVHVAESDYDKYFSL